MKGGVIVSVLTAVSSRKTADPHDSGAPWHHGMVVSHVLDLAAESHVRSARQSSDGFSCYHAYH
jgi:hypothetical protein